MPTLAFNVWASQLETAIRIIRRGLDAAERALNEETVRTIEEGNELDRKIARGEELGYQLDEDGDLAYDPHEHLHYEHMAIDETLHQVRKSMMVTLYHAWERTARDVTNRHGSRDNHAVLELALNKKGIILTPELEHLRRLVNLVKHNSKKKMLQLWEVRPDLFYDNFDPDEHFPNDWEQTIEISREQVESFFAAVVASGPTHEPHSS